MEEKYIKILLKLIHIYQIMPLSSHSKCKFYPTCSNYAKEAINIHGAFKGSLLSIKRILKSVFISYYFILFLYPFKVYLIIFYIGIFHCENIIYI